MQKPPVGEPKIVIYEFPGRFQPKAHYAELHAAALIEYLLVVMATEQPVQQACANKQKQHECRGNTLRFKSQSF